MAFNQVQYIGPKDKVTTTPGKKGGGKAGGVIGGVIGGAAGAIAGTPGGPAGMIAGGMAGAAGGAALGERLGEMASPSRAESSAMERRIGTQGAEVFHSQQSDKLRQSLMALNSAPPEVQEAYKAPLAQAYMTSVAMDNPKPGQPGAPMPGRPTYG